MTQFFAEVNDVNDKKFQSKEKFSYKQRIEKGPLIKLGLIRDNL